MPRSASAGPIAEQGGALPAPLFFAAWDAFAAGFLDRIKSLSYLRRMRKLFLKRHWARSTDPKLGKGEKHE